MGFSSSHGVPVPPGLPVVVVVCHQLEWVVCLLPPDGFSACYVVPHMLTQNIGGNGEPVCGFSFISGINNEIRKEYLGTCY